MPLSEPERAWIKVSGGDEPTERTLHTSSDEILDEEALFARLEDEGLSRRLLALFVTDFPFQLEALKKALREGEERAVERQAHTIKGAAANVEARALCGVAYAIETAGKAGDLEAVRSLMIPLDREFARLTELLSQRNNSGAAEGKLIPQKEVL